MTLTKYSNPNDLGLVARRKLSMRLTSHENDTGLSSTAHGERSSRSKVKLECGANTASSFRQARPTARAQPAVGTVGTELTCSVLSTFMIL